MSAEDTISDAAGAISADRFVEISYDEVIPNNVALGSDKQLQRALETWRPNYLGWWNGMGTVGYQQSEVYLRTAVGVDPAAVAVKAKVGDRRKTLEAYASKTADAMSDEITKQMAKQGWIKLNDKGDVVP